MAAAAWAWPRLRPPTSRRERRAPFSPPASSAPPLAAAGWACIMPIANFCHLAGQTQTRASINPHSPFLCDGCPQHHIHFLPNTTPLSPPSSSCTTMAFAHRRRAYEIHPHTQPLYLNANPFNSFLTAAHQPRKPCPLREREQHLPFTSPRARCNLPAAHVAGRAPPPRDVCRRSRFT